MKEIKRFSFEIKEINDTGTFDGYASTFGKATDGIDEADSDGDIILPGAFEETLGESKGIIPILWQHDTHQPIGWNTWAKEDDHGLAIKGDLLTQDAKAITAREWMKKGVALGGRAGLSIGYTVLDFYKKNGVRFLTKLKLWEYSVVTWAADFDAFAMNVKSHPYAGLSVADETRGWDSGAARGRVKKWATADGATDWKRYQKAFLWHDQEKPEDLSSYRFPIADIVDDELRVVPKGILAAVVELKKSDLAEQDRENVQRHLERYCKKLGKASPFTDEPAKPTQGVTPIMDFNKTLEAQKAVQAHGQNRRAIENAHEANLKSIYDSDSSIEDKKLAVKTSMDQYCKARTDWHEKDLDMGASGDHGAVSFEPWTLGYGYKGSDEDRETKTRAGKSGRTISSATAASMKSVAQKLATGIDMYQKAAAVMADAQDDLTKMLPVNVNGEGVPNDTDPEPIDVEANIALKSMMAGGFKGLFEKKAA